ncbi:aminopeptidase N [Eurytemora carolleeae]|uniref:aminopeptidase N n=1 Tax=Eurytemora carolleeae TaxID=1294199 RepID=UPI000C78D5CF|nr:aminopeptidase N [Eurytemora carolleeae]|eukprot:XP_023324912.1 aminopeptidase N-like [Eurytemora affinis]
MSTYTIQNQRDGGASAEPEAEPSSHVKVTDVRLPRHLVPESYRLKLIPFIVPDNFTIRGYVEIDMVCTEPGKNITLHSADLEIQNRTVQVQQINGSALNVRSYDYDKDREFFVLNLGSMLEKGKRYTVKISFTAFLKDNLKGFYRSQYKDLVTGKDEFIAVTQFQATDARRSFPCFDEPALKAKFEVSLGRTRDMSSISNMPIRIEGEDMAEDTSYVWDHYMESVKMSTYLVAFVVSKFDNREETRSNNVKFRIWSRSDAVDQTEYARDIGPKILEFFENYFQVPFPLPKQDMIAIPDFGAGAMENWGLITYRETALLYKDGVSAASNRERIAIVISHELAHQWFGNLVTPSWWSDLWLNEGFASYVEYLGVDAVKPELKLLEQFVVQDLQDVLRIDALESSHPISIPVKHPDEISEIFDRISYGKGASIIRMMDNFLTSKTFKQGLTNYLTELKFKAAEQDDLWRHLTQQGHRDGTLPSEVTIKEIMDTWTLQTGFPVLTVQRDYTDSTAIIKQERFLLSAESSDPATWWIPVTFTSPGPAGDFNNTYNNIWMAKGERSKSISGLPAADEPVIFNVQETGYYRVNYDEKNWEMIAKKLETDFRSIHVINRAQILDDALEMAKVGRLSYSIALKLTGYLDKETEYIPWYSALSGLSHINKMLKRTAAYGDFKRYMLRLLGPVYSRVGYSSKPTDTHLDILLRKIVVSWACSMDHPDCLNQAKSKFGDWMKTANPDSEGSNPIDVNLKSETYCHGISAGTEKEWDFAWNRYTSSNVASEKATLLSALTCTKEIWLLNRFLNMSLTPDSGVRKQDGAKVIGGIASNTVGRYLTFDFIREQWKTIQEYWGSASFTMPGIMQRALSGRNTEFELEELNEFKTKHINELATSRRAVDQAIEAAQVNIAWIQNNLQVVWDWLKNYNISG